MHNPNSQRGFTLPELLVIMGIVVMLLSVVTINLTTSHRKTAVNAGMSQLISDMKQQQLKAMVGEVEGGTVQSNYGIHFNTSSYVLFRGSSYVASDPTNFTITLENTIAISGTAQTIIFAKVTGEVVSYNSSLDTVTYADTTSTSVKSLEFNRYGIITSVN